MTPGEYLLEAHQRLALRRHVRAAAALTGAALLITAALAWLVSWLVPAAVVMVWVRVALYGGILAAVAWLIWWQPDRRQVARSVEARVPAFHGRLLTWLDAQRRGDSSPLVELLTRQTAAIAAQHPAQRLVPARQLAWPAGAAVAALALLAALLVGSEPWQLAAQRVWLGGLLADAQPRILVSPGSIVVRRGSDVVIDAEGHGFLPDDMQVHAAFGPSGWERAPMSRHGTRSYGFVFVGVTEEIEYYVSARGLTSTRHRIRVADLPTVTDVAVTYRFPAWTGREPARYPAGDVTALPGTRVDVSVATDRAVPEALLVQDGEAATMTRAGDRLQGSFEVSRAGDWHVAVPHEGALARISDSFLIRIAEDAPPEIEYRFPGHDRKATSIEEVVLGFEATDDYGVEALELNYAVNGGDWVKVPLDGAAGEHLLALEGLAIRDGGGERALQPGDVISLYGEARDHGAATRTALYFVDVRPFDMRYRESQQMGGGQGGGEGGGLDIAERQRDILSATWNLINKRPDMAPEAVRDQADVLAMLQRTLRDQVQTLVARAEARGLGTGDDVSVFLQELDSALDYMEPAAVQLDGLALDDAVPPEQQALRHLVTAEASVRDVDVSMSRSDTRGTSGRSLGELVELEMDRERNRYEMPQQPGLGDPAAAEQEQDWKRLEELAARQERLARQQDRNPQSLPSRWEQARLQRELEELRRQLESRRNSGGGTSPASLERAIADLGAAGEALERQDADPAAREQAGEALRRAARSLRESSRGDLQERLGRTERQVANLEADQARVMEALEQLQQSALDRARNGERIGRSDYAMQTFGAVKRRMQQDLADLRRDLTDLSEAVADRDPDGARMLDRAMRELDEVRLEERLAASAEAFEVGQPLYVIGSEAMVEQALQRLGRRIGQARDTLADESARQGTDPLQEIRALRRRLADARDDDGGLAEAEVEAIAQSLDRLAPDADVRQDGASLGDRRSSIDDGVYQIRGTAPENTETLYRLSLERLDLMEVALEVADSPPVRAQEPREAGRDSEAVARYFRDLSRRTMQDDD